ncbi:MAG: hypothetical protein WDA27_10985 [Actinomycetota bacterium]
MGEAPKVRVISGRPTPQEEHAARLAIVRLWQEDAAAEARAASGNPWVMAGRVEGARQSFGAVRASAGPDSWRVSGRISAGSVSRTQRGQLGGV